MIFYLFLIVYRMILTVFKDLNLVERMMIASSNFSFVLLVDISFSLENGT